MKKAAVLATVLLLALAPYAAATCNLDIIDEFIPVFHVGTPGSFTFTPCCGTPPYTFSLYSGTMPPGLTLGSDGTISGTPTTAGQTVICVTVTDSGGCQLTKCFYITVNP